MPSLIEQILGSGGVTAPGPEPGVPPPPQASARARQANPYDRVASFIEFTLLTSVPPVSNNQVRIMGRNANRRAIVIMPISLGAATTITFKREAPPTARSDGFAILSMSSFAGLLIPPFFHVPDDGTEEIWVNNNGNAATIAFGEGVV